MTELEPATHLPQDTPPGRPHEKTGRIARQVPRALQLPALQGLQQHEPATLIQPEDEPAQPESQRTHRRTHHRKDFAIAPPAPTLLDAAQAQGREVVALGKIGDIFAMRGVSTLIKGDGNAALFDRLLEQVGTAPDGALVFANFVDFDQNFGHRRDVDGYAQALEAFDARLPALRQTLRPGDLCVITADHGCDPTWPGTDHTREFVPQLFFGPGVAPRALAARSSFCDLGQTLAAHLGLPPLSHGTVCALG